MGTRKQLDLEFGPPPPDLTQHIVKTENQYSAAGGFGDVYKCLCHSGSVPVEVAVKAFRFKFTMEGNSDKMLRRELGIWKRLDHINVVPFLGIAYGFGISDSMSLVSLWMPNESLHKFLVKQNDALDVQLRLQLLLDVANGLQYLHSFPVVHGDLNSNNVLIDGDGTARLADFGYASLVGKVPEGLTYLQRTTTRPGALRWCAPEQLDPDNALGRSAMTDIYSFGCIALEVLSGKQPWSEIQVDVAITFRLAKGYTPGRPESRAIDDAHWNFIQRCWSSSVKRRPVAKLVVSTVKEFVELSSAERRPVAEPIVSTMPGFLESSSTPNSVSTMQRFLGLSSIPNSTMDVIPAVRFSSMGRLRWLKGAWNLPFQLNADDIVVFVVGPSGSGKGLFVKEVTKSGQIRISKDLQPCTTTVTAIRCELTEEAKKSLGNVRQKHIVLVDTPSFHTGVNDEVAGEEMKNWLVKSNCQSSLAAVIYMQKVEWISPYEPIQRYLNTFVSKFPLNFPCFPVDIRVVFSYEGVISTEKAQERKREFEEQLFSLGSVPGRNLTWSVSSHPKLLKLGDTETAWDAVVALISSAKPLDRLDRDHEWW